MMLLDLGALFDVLFFAVALAITVKICGKLIN
jgi:hypothetical protein